MAQITAAMVNELRNKTGQGMMECKKALTETGGDVEKAIEFFRKKGVKTSITERAAKEGRIQIANAPNCKAAALVEINTNTDFTAKSDEVLAILDKAAAKLLSNGSVDLNNDTEIKDLLINVSQKTGENVQLGRSAFLQGETVGSFLYVTAGKGKIGVLMQFNGNADQDLAKNIGMHIVANKPLTLSRDQIPADVLGKEREIAIEQAKATGKPQQIAEKIAEGKLNSFYTERVLLDQEFVRSEVFKGTVANLLKSKGATLEKYVRIEVGQQ
jgi:elongation factor Ts